MWVDDEVEYFKDIIEGRHYKDIAIMMTEKFGYKFGVDQLRKKAKLLGIKTGLIGRFEKGHLTNSVDVGSESIDRDGYVIVKVAEPNVWEYKHKVIWIKANGDIPKGYTLIFADKNKLNVKLDNLILVTKRELLVMNQNKLLYDNKECTVTGLNVARLLIKISDVKKGR